MLIVAAGQVQETGEMMDAPRHQNEINETLLYGQVLARRAVSAAMPRYPHYE